MVAAIDTDIPGKQAHSGALDADSKGPCATSPDASAPRLESSDGQTDGPVTDSNLEPAGTLKAQKASSDQFLLVQEPVGGYPRCTFHAGSPGRFFRLARA